MVAALTTITQVIQFSPELVNAGLCFGFVFGFFKTVGDLLADKTNWKIARWIRLKSFETGVVADEAANWPKTFAEVFDRVFGTEHWSLKCFWRSCLASYCAVIISFTVWAVRFPFYGSWKNAVFLTLICGSIGNVPFDYVSLLETRWLLGVMSKTKSGAVLLGLVLTDAIVTLVLGVIGGLLADRVYYSVMEWRRPELWCVGAAQYNCHEVQFSHYLLELKVAIENPAQLVDVLAGKFLLWLAAAFFTSIWLWLYAGAGFLLRFVLGFDMIFNWFNRKFDIEKKPLQSIGLVAGALVAIVYWTAVIVSRVVG
jgi:hypothetical protein